MDDDELEHEHTRSYAYDIAVSFVYALAVGVNVYLVANELSNGALSRSLSIRLAYWRQKLGNKYSEHTAVKRSFPRMYWEAINIVEGNDK